MAYGPPAGGGYPPPQPPPRPAARGGGVGCLVFLLVAVAVLGYGGYWLLFKPSASDTPPARASDLRLLCGQKQRYFPGADAHAASGPRPILIFKEGTSSYTQASISSTQGVPAAHWTNYRTDPLRIQLVACLHEPEDGPRIGTCEFTSRTMSLYQGRYEADLFEVKTGKKVAEAELTGRTTRECPGIKLWREGDAPKVHTTPDFAEYRRAFGRYVD